jgi:hypothetical protein
MLSACGPNGGPQPSAPTASIPLRPTLNPDTQPAVDAALAEAATHLGVDSTALRVDQVEARQWSDASLGCPRPGIMYAQIVTPGFLIMISSGARQLEYHSDTRARVVLCNES